jgi:hypothetical protein
LNERHIKVSDYPVPPTIKQSKVPLKLDIAKFAAQNNITLLEKP